MVWDQFQVSGALGRMVCLVRLGQVDWTVLALAGFSVLGFAACSAESEPQNVVETTGAGGTGTAGPVTSTGPTSTASSAGPTATTGSATSAGASNTAASSSSSVGTTGTSLGGTTDSSAATTATTGTGGATSTVTGDASSTTTATTGGGNPDTYNPDFVEFVGEDCTVGEPQDVNESKLPDLFTLSDGSSLTTVSGWACHRAAIKKAVEKYIEGERPGTPDTVTGTVSDSSIAVHVEHAGNSIDFSAAVQLPPNATGPVPAIIYVGPFSLSRAILNDEGVATIALSEGAIANEDSRNGLFTDIYGNTGTSALVAWGWGASRIIDVLLAQRDAGANDIIDPTGIGVTGCSRWGKGAFVMGAFDERIALGIPQESGTGGVAALRIVNTNPTGPNGGEVAQSIASAWSEAPGWFGSAFGNYRNNVNTMPVDMHSLVAMYAPRGLLVLDNSRIGHLAALPQHGAALAGAEVYKALGVEKNIAYHGGNPDDPHDHCTFQTTQEEPLRRAIKAHLTKTAAPDGRMEPQPVATADLADWRTWTTPTLTP